MTEVIGYATRLEAMKIAAKYETEGGLIKVAGQILEFLVPTPPPPGPVKCSHGGQDFIITANFKWCERCGRLWHNGGWMDHKGLDS